jgi:ATP-dependent helicase HrpA
MRHEAAGVTSEAFPRTVRLGGVDCTVSYLHEPGHPRDGVTVTLPLFALNQASDERAQWLVPGMLADKVMALLKSLPQKPRARLVPLPAFAESFIARTPFGQGALLAALLGAVRERTQLDVKAADFKQEQLPPHLLMNFCVVDEQGRQLAMGRHLPALKAELSHQARGAFQALAALKLGARGDAGGAATMPSAGAASSPSPEPVGEAGRRPPTHPTQPSQTHAAAGATPTGPFTQWSFDELPEIMEIRKGGHTLIGFPALVDGGDHVDLEVFDEPEVAARKHREGLRRLVALQIREPLKYLEKNLPDLQKLTMLYMNLGTAQELVQQIVEVSLDRAFLLEPLPRNAAEFTARVEQGRPRLNLIAQEVSRLALSILTEYAAAQRKLKDAKAGKEVAEDLTQQLARLCGKHFLARTPYAQLQHFPRYLKGMVLRLDKWRADPARDAQRLAEIRPLEQRYWRRVAELKGAQDARLDEFRWLLEELRVSLFAQELRTPQPVSVKRLEKAWSAMAQ